MRCWRLRDLTWCTWKLRVNPGKHLTRTSHVWQGQSISLQAYLAEQELSGKPVCDDRSPAASWESGQDLRPSVGDTDESQQYFRCKEFPRTKTLTRSEDGELVASPGLAGEQLGNWLSEVELNDQQQCASQDVEIDVFLKLAWIGECPGTD